MEIIFLNRRYCHPGVLFCPEKAHPHNIDKEEAVVDLEYFVHYAGPKSRMTVHDSNVEETLCGE